MSDTVAPSSVARLKKEAGKSMQLKAEQEEI